MHAIGLLVFGVGCFFSGAMAAIYDELRQPLTIRARATFAFFLVMALSGGYLAIH